MRFAAQRTIALQDNHPCGDTVYMPDIQDKGGSMIKALREWEKRRGITFTFKGKFIEPKKRKQQQKNTDQKAKPKQQSDRPITVPRERMKPGRKSTLTKEEKRQIKNERNRLYRTKNAEMHRQRSRDWRGRLTPEQKQEVYRKHREWRAAKKAAANVANGLRDAGVPHNNPVLQDEARGS